MNQTRIHNILDNPCHFWCW